MAREVNVFFGDPVALGTNAQSPAYEITVTMEITRRSGEKVTRQRVIRWPQVLRNLAPDRLAEIVRDVCIEQMRREEDTD